MTSQEMNNFIKNYIESSKLRSAIMINGPWGIGKSYYIENDLVPFIKKECDYDIIQISLYGLTTIKDLIKQIYMEVRAKKLICKNEKLAVGKIVAKSILNGITSFFNINTNITEDDFQQLYQSLDLSKKLLIFEDLERSQIDVLEVIGFINTLVDQDKVKIIVVANEEEIIKRKLIFNSETKKLESIYSDFEKKYLQVKEKTISETLLFAVDLKQAIISISDSFDNKILNALLIDDDYLKQIIKILTDNKHENLRTIIFAFQKAIDIFNYLGEKQESYIYKKILNDITKISVLLKSGNIEKDNIELKDKILNDYVNLSTNFCCRYIICQELDEVSVKKGIQQIIKEDMACRQNIIDPDIDIITNFYNNDDDEILNSFKNIIKKLEENKFSARDLGTIASYTIYLKNYIVFDNKKILDLIVDCIKEDKISWDYPFYSRIIQDNETSKKEFNDLVETIDKIVKEKDEKKTETNLNTLIFDSLGFYKYVSNNSNEFLNKRKFLSLINETTFKSFIYSAKPSDITLFRNALQAVYCFSNINEFYSQDSQFIYSAIQVMKPLTDSKEFSKMKILVLQWLMNDLKKILINLGFTEDSIK